MDWQASASGNSEVRWAQSQWGSEEAFAKGRSTFSLLPALPSLLLHAWCQTRADRSTLAGLSALLPHLSPRLPLLRALYNFNAMLALVQLLLQICKFLDCKKYRVISDNFCRQRNRSSLQVVCLDSRRRLAAASQPIRVGADMILLAN